ncbi:MAG: hypothetical protein JWO08_3826 [Verrucomicrobiaceae bacterium]|nr:hypothetical protein [Verrucomicrobiaceae bacterium]
MSFVPSKRLLWIVALVIVPAWLVLGMAGAPLELLVLAGVAVVGLAAVDALTSSHQLDGIKVELPPLLRTSKGKIFDLDGVITNKGQPIKALRIGLPLPRQLGVESPEAALFMPADGSAAKPMWKVQALERGSYTIPRCHLETPSKLGLWDMRGAVDCVCEVRVYPDLSRERNLLAPLFFRKGATGIHQVRQLGKGREFEQLRSYAPGDSYNDIYWKGTAKRRLPVTMMHQIERTQEIHVILDISRRSARPLEVPPGTGEKDPFAPKTQCERFIQAALVLALAAEQQGDRFGLMTFSDQVHTTLPASTGRAHYNACRDALYTLEPHIVSPDFNELFVSIGNRLRHRSLLIVLTDLGEPWLSESFLDATRQAARRHVVLVHVLGSKEFQPLFHRNDSIAHADDLYHRMAGHMMWSDLQETTRDLKQCGVHLTSSLQETLIANVVSEYLNVKKRQLL